MHMALKNECVAKKKTYTLIRNFRCYRLAVSNALPAHASTLKQKWQHICCSILLLGELRHQIKALLYEQAIFRILIGLGKARRMCRVCIVVGRIGFLRVSAFL